MAFLLNVFQARATGLTWDRLASDHIVDGEAAGPFVKDQAYFALRLKELYVAHNRKLWVKLFPMLYSYIEHGGREQNTVAGPGQLREFGESNLDRVINLNFPLTDRTVYTGEDVNILVGLYSVRAGDAARGLIDMAAKLSALGGLAVGAAVQAADVVKNGVENILNLDGSVLQLGVRDTVNAGREMKPGVYLGINAPAIEMNRLWLRDGHLVLGDDPVEAQPYRDRDYIVIEIERHETRHDWRRLPGIVDFESKFNAIFRDGVRSDAEKRAALNAVFAELRDVLRTSQALTIPDRENIERSVRIELQRRMDESEGKVFEERSASHAPTRSIDFDFADVSADPSEVPGFG